ncbi:MAG TPA: helicase-related protein, partial [Solirubrobacteraceae bacterium]|nr:helicase-related protein [Solirubrobacteraceae bacterium]
VAADASHARRIAALIHEATGQSPVLVLHTDSSASTKLARFRNSTAPWIVAVNMVSEGVDIPRLRVGVYATAAKTPLVFRQIVGRFVRTIPSQPPHPSWLYLPAEPTLRAHAAHIESELRHALPSRSEAELEDRPDRLPPREPSPEEQFVPLSAEFAAQMTLFGAPSPAVTRGPGGALASAALDPDPVPQPPPHIPAPHAEPPAAAPAFERRAQLRRQRTSLVADLHRHTSTTHRDINAWLNRSLGLTRVDEATIPQLERSIELLQRELSHKPSRPPASSIPAIQSSP